MIGDRHVLTCAHVVNTALGRAQRAQDKPGLDARIQIDFPILGDAEGAPLRSCKVEVWTPPPVSGVSGGDVAGLVLLGEGLPSGAGPSRLIGSLAGPGSAAEVFGYPNEPSRRGLGAQTVLHLRGAVDGGIIQLDGDSEAAIRAQPGYSGSPVVVKDDAGDAVVGMLAVASLDEDTRDAYAIPVSQLIQAWPDVLADQTIPPCPYRGLQAFTAEDAEAGLFVGRDAEISQLREMLGKQVFVVVTGPSGVGKSSLVNAGLVRALRAEGWIAESFRPGGTPVNALATALLRVEQPGGTRTLEEVAKWESRLRSEALARLGSQLMALRDAPILLCADQFEQVLDPGTCPPDARAEFLDLVLAMRIGPAEGLRLVCTLRADFLSPLLEHPGAGARLRDRLFPLVTHGPGEPGTSHRQAGRDHGA